MRAINVLLALVPGLGDVESPSSQLESSNINPAVNCYLHNSCAGNESSHGLAGGQLWLWPMSGWGETLWLLPNILWFSSSSSHYWPAASDTLTRWRHTRTSGRGRAVWEGWIIILLYHLPTCLTLLHHNIQRSKLFNIRSIRNFWFRHKITL